MYYKTKLQLHNFTVYQLNNQNVTLYIWNEVDGGVTCNEFTTCIIDFIAFNAIEDNDLEQVTLISDGCGYKNRNRVLSSALSDLAIQKNITISQLFLPKVTQ